MNDHKLSDAKKVLMLTSRAPGKLTASVLDIVKTFGPDCKIEVSTPDIQKLQAELAEAKAENNQWHNKFCNMQARLEAERDQLAAQLKASTLELSDAMAALMKAKDVMNVAIKNNTLYPLPHAVSMIDQALTDTKES